MQTNEVMALMPQSELKLIRTELEFIKKLLTQKNEESLENQYIESKQLLKKELAEIKANLQPKQPSDYLTRNAVAQLLKANSLLCSDKKKWSKNDESERRIFLIVFHDREQVSKKSDKLKLKNNYIKWLGSISLSILSKLLLPKIPLLIEIIKELLNYH